MYRLKYKVLVVDDEPDMLEIISFSLKREGYEVYTADNGKEGIELALKYKPHLIIMDIMMPEMDGIELCERIRSMDELEDPVIAFLTARSEDYSQIAGFKAGADDYITKPVKIKVLINRVKALLRRYKINDELEVPLIEHNNNRIHKGDLEIDREKYLVVRNGVEMSLPRKEFKLLLLLSSKPDKVFTRENIFSYVWGEDVVVGERTIDVHIRKLREKIGNNHIITVKGVGYKYKE
jgi:two-component system alkaline phosphatase synthesis response regulator PhoP